MCSQGCLWVLAPQPAQLVCPLGCGKSCWLHTTIALEQLPLRAFLQEQWLENIQAPGKKPYSSPGRHGGKGLGGVAELDKAPHKAPHNQLGTLGQDAEAWGLEL